MRLEIQHLLHQGKHAAVKFIQIIHISLPATIVVDRGAARIFLRGGLKLWKQKPCKGKIACD